MLSLSRGILRLRGPSIGFHQGRHRYSAPRPWASVARPLSQLPADASDQAKSVMEDKANERQYHMRMMKLLARHLWPSGSEAGPAALGLKQRVVASVSLMVAAKFVTITVPYIFKAMIDGFSASEAARAAARAGEQTAQAGGGGDGGVGLASASSSSLAEGAAAMLDIAQAEPLLAAPAALAIGYGAARTTAAGCQELRSTIFSTVAQRAIRQVPVFLSAAGLQEHGPKRSCCHLGPQ